MPDTEQSPGRVVVIGCSRNEARRVGRRVSWDTGGCRLCGRKVHCSEGGCDLSPGCRHAV